MESSFLDPDGPDDVFENEMDQRACDCNANLEKRVHGREKSTRAKKGSRAKKEYIGEKTSET